MRAELRTLFIIWVAMLGALGVYVAIGEVLTPSVASPPEPYLRYACYAAALAQLVAIPFIRRTMLAGKLGATDRGGQGDAPGAGAYLTAVIVSLALAESIGLYGLVLVALGFPVQVLHEFVFISAVALVIHRPKAAELERTIRARGQRSI